MSGRERRWTRERNPERNRARVQEQELDQGPELDQDPRIQRPFVSLLSAQVRVLLLLIFLPISTFLLASCSTHLLTSKPDDRTSGPPQNLIAEIEASFRTRQLGRAHLLLAKGIALQSEESLGEVGPLHLWKELLDLASCAPLSVEQRKAHEPQNRWEILIALARLERMRWERATLEAGEGRRWPTPLSEELFAEAFDLEMAVGTLSNSSASSKHVEYSPEPANSPLQHSEASGKPAEFESTEFRASESKSADSRAAEFRAAESRSADSKAVESRSAESLAKSADTLAWPWQQEIWPDEFPLPPGLVSHCADLELFAQLEAEHPQGLRGWRLEELAQLRALKAKLNPEHPSWFALLVQESALLLAQGNLDEALRAVEKIEESQLRAALPAHRDGLLLMLALAWEKRGEGERALAAFEALESSPYLQQHHAFIATRVLSSLALHGRWEEVLDHPQISSPPAGERGAWLAWLKGKALAELGEDARLFEHVRASLRAHPRWQDEASLSLLADLLYGRLAQASFDDKVLELVESLASPREIYLRLERLAQVAFERGEFAFSEAVIRWLLANHKAPAVQPRYQGLWARVAFERGDLQGFRRLVKGLSTASVELQRAIPAGRRGTFFLERDQELLTLLSHVLSRLPEKGDKRWGKVLADHVGRFVRESEQSRVYAQVVELYRSLRVMLEEDDRAWAERVGASAPPLVLGEWVVERSEPWPDPPKAPLHLGEPDFLVHVPLGFSTEHFTLWLEGPVEAALQEPESP